MMRIEAMIVGMLLAAGVAEAQPTDDGAPLSALFSPREDEVTRTFRLLDRNTVWEPVATVTVDFPTFHTQGLVKIGDVFFVSAVEVLERTTRNEQSTDARLDFTIDRSTGAGRGWLFKFDASGHLLAKTELTAGSVYHPGGIDFDGEKLWVPVAEYRPNSRANIFRVDPETMEAELLFSEDDHIGGLVFDPLTRTLHGVSWGSRRFYSWHLLGGQPVTRDWTLNPSHYLDYQDCHLRGVGFMLCGGVTGFATPAGSVALGGLELVDLWRKRPVHQLPVNQFVDEGEGPKQGLSLTHNPFWVERLPNGKLRFYFMPESDNQAELRIYDATPWIERD